LAEKLVKTIKHEGLYFEYWITFILYVLANKISHFESDIIYWTPSVNIVLCTTIRRREGKPNGGYWPRLFCCSHRSTLIFALPRAARRVA
jgi:hypothetical protein